MSLRTEIDFSRFKPVIDRALANSSRELSVAVNARMYFLFKRAQDICKRASRQSILKLHGGDESRFFTSKGKPSKSTKKRKGLTQDLAQVNASIASMIGRAKRGIDVRAIKYAPTRVFGGQSGSRGELEVNARKWLAGKLKAVGFIASLFTMPMRRFDRYAAQKAARGGKDRFTGKHNSLVVVAQPAKPASVSNGFNPTALAGFRIGAGASGEEVRPYGQSIAITAMQRGINIETAEMLRHLEEKAKKACRDAGMEVR